ncbi:unnamed protein product [Lathyrus oleraceus]
MAAESLASSINDAPQVHHQVKGYHTDILNAYFMHPNENHGNVLATSLLSGLNYHFWSWVVTVALRSEHKLHFINGALPRPSDDDDKYSIAWGRCSTMIISWTINYVEPEISQIILWMDTTPEIGKSSKIDSIKVMYFESLIFKKKFTL